MSPHLWDRHLLSDGARLSAERGNLMIGVGEVAVDGADAPLDAGVLLVAATACCCGTND